MCSVRARAFYKAVTVDRSGVLEQILELLNRLSVPYCVVGGQAVNAYVEPLVSLDLDLVVAAENLPQLLAALPPAAAVEHFADSVNVTFPESDLRLQFQTDPRYMDFPARATIGNVLGTELRVASPEDVLVGKVWAANDGARRPSKRLKDLADIARLLERFPDLRRLVTPNLLDKLM